MHSLVIFALSSGIVYGMIIDDKLAYPETQKSGVVDILHGIRVPDPYRWLEDSESPETRAWIEAQNKITFGFLESIPAREPIRARMTKLWDYERYGMPWKEGGRYFYWKNDGLQNQSVLYTMDALDAEPRVLLDPNKMSEDGTVAVAGTSVTRDGRRMAYAISVGGSDWREWKVLDVATGEDLEDHIRWSKFSGAAWDHAGEGFYYSRYDEPVGAALTEANYYQKLYYHKLGTPQSEDVLIYERPDQKEWGFGGWETDDGRYLMISVWEGTERNNRVFYKDLSATQPEGGLSDTPVELLPDADASYSFVGNDGPVFWFVTDLDAPKQRVIAIDTRSPERDNWKTVVPESEETLESVSLVGNRFFASYLKDAHTQVRMFELDGKPIGEVELPGLGSAGGFGGRREYTETFYSYTSFTQPNTIYRFDIEEGESEVFRAPEVDFDPGAYEVKQVFYHSKDGTRVPMFIVHRKGLSLDGTNPTYLYGYGGFNISQTPWFSVSNLVWLEMGGVLAVANIRGGGEYGKEWHEAGRKRNRQNVFDDFIAAAEYLIETKYTRPSRLSIGGGSNGGLLVGAAMTQRPDLFGAALPAVGVLDMLRFHKFTIGWAWVSDYGSPDDDGDFMILLSYSPLHNLQPGAHYPATLVTTGDHDDRVVPAHSFKFAAALQEAQGGPAPTLIRIETRAGHGAGKPTWMVIEELTDRWAFLTRTLGFELPEGFGR